MSPIAIVAIVVGVGYLLVRRLAGQRVEMKSLLVMPAVLTVVGVTEIDDLGHAGAGAIGVMLGGVVISMLIGVLRGATVRFGVRDGELWMRYRVSTVLLWLVNIAAKAALVPVAGLVGGGAATLSEQSIMLAIGLGILVESAVVYLRGDKVARQLGVTLAWSVDKDGTVRTAPANPVRRGADTSWTS